MPQPRYPYRQDLEHSTDPKELVLQRLSDPEHLCAALGLRVKRRPAGKVLIDCPDCGCPNCAVRHVPDKGIVLWRCPACDAAGNAYHLIAKVRRLDVRRDFEIVLAAAARLAGMDPEVVLGRRRVAVERPRKEDEVDFAAVLATLDRQPAPKVRRPAPVASPEGEDLADVLARMGTHPWAA